MKKWMFALVLMSATSAFAVNLDMMDRDMGPSYLSWCTQDNKIASQNEQGVVVVNADCTVQGLKCQELKVQKLNHVYAVCK